MPHTPIPHEDAAAMLIIRAAVPALRAERCAATRALALDMLAKLAPEEEAEQLAITAKAIRDAEAAQALLAEIVAQQPAAQADERRRAEALVMDAAFEPLRGLALADAEQRYSRFCASHTGPEPFPSFEQFVADERRRAQR
jgi:hypothetical protein